MSKTSISLPLRGIIPPLVTPLLDADRLDVESTERIVEHVLAGGVHGLFILGTTGEAPGLSYRLRREVIDCFARQVAGRVPLLVGITDTSFAESVALAEHAADAGADAAVLATPFYFQANQSDLIAYTERLAAKSPLPIFLYGIPSHAKLTFAPETVDRLLDVPNIIGLKDSSGQMMYFHQLKRIIARRPDFTLLVGPEELLAEAILLGGHGGVCGGANMFPRLYVDLFDAASRGDLRRVRELHDRVTEISMRLYTLGANTSSYLKGLKCALSLLNLCGDRLAEPLQRFEGEEKSSIAKHLREMGLLK